MPAVSLSPIFNGYQGFTINGLPNTGGLINTYLAGTSTPAATYTTNSGSVANTNPIQLDASGHPPQEIWLVIGTGYRFVVTDALGLNAYTYDNIVGVGDGVAQLASSLAASSGSSLVGFIQAGTGAVARTVQSKNRERVTVADFGAVGDGVTDDAPAFRAAIAAAVTIYADPPPVAYLISSSASIAIPDGKNLVMTGQATINVTANAGSTASANALFSLTGSGSFEGGYINYPNQCASDLVASIISYPPTFLFNGSHLGAVKNVRVKGAYDLFRQDASDFANLTLQNVYADIVHQGASFVGHMGDVSTADNVQIILNNPNVGFNGGPVDLWCRAHSIGWQFAPTGGNRIDLFRFIDSGVVGGWRSYVGGGNGTIWLDFSNWHSDITTQAFVGQFSNLVLGNGWISQMDAFFTAAHTPAIQLTATSKVKMTGVEVSLLAAGSSCPIVGTSLDLSMSSCRFSTSKGYFTPVVYCDFGLHLDASGCTVSTSNATAIPLAFTDVTSFDSSGVTIDGIRAFGKITGSDLGPSNFNMSGYTSGVPTNWTTNAGTPANFFRAIGSPGIEIFPTPAATGAFYLDYSLTTAISHMFGYFYVTGVLQLIDGVGTAVIGTFEWTIGNATDGFNAGTPFLGNGGTNAECSGLPANTLLTFGSLLAVPQNPTDTLSVRLMCNYPASINQLKLQLTSLQLWNVAAFATPTLENANGHEFIRPGVTTANARDSIMGGIRQFRRLTSPVTSIPALSGDRTIRNPAAIGSPKAWVPTTLGATPVWTSEGNL